MGRTKSRLLPSLLVAGLVIAAYSNSLEGPFIFDDNTRIVDNPAIRSVWPPSDAMQGTNRPFAFYTFAINYALHGLGVRGYHLTNLAIHVLGGLLLLGILARTLALDAKDSTWHLFLRSNATWIAICIAALWAVHPIQTQAVTYVVQRLESLMGLCYLATLYFFIRGVQSDSRWMLCLSVVCCALGMGCKEVMVTAPLIVLWYDRVFVASSWSSIWKQRRGYYALLASCWGVLAWAMLRFTGDYRGGALVAVEGLTPWLYLLNQSAVILHYLRLCVLPTELCFYYRWPVETSIVALVPSHLTVLALFLVTLVAMFRIPRVGFLLGAFFLILGPTSSVVPIADLAFEHRMYLPSISVCVLIVLGIVRLAFQFQGNSVSAPTSVRRARIFWTGLGLICILSIAGLSYATYQRNTIYQSRVALWQDTVTKAPQNSAAWNNLGLAYKSNGDRKSACDAYAKQAELEDSDASVLAAYGGALLEVGRFDEAKTQLEKALLLDASDYYANLNFGQWQYENGAPDLAIPYFETVLNATPDHLACQLDLAAAYVSTGRFEAAAALSKSTLEQAPASAAASLNLACAFGGMGNATEAIKHCRAALELDPQLANAHATLAILLQSAEPETAIKHLQLASELDPGSATFDIALGDMLLASNLEAALQAYQHGLQKEPTNAVILLRQASIWESQGRRADALEALEKAKQLQPDWPEVDPALRRLRGSSP